MVLMKSQAPESRKITLPSAEDREWLLGLVGSRWTSIGLPSGGEIAAVEGHRWRVKAEEIMGVRTAVVSLENRP
jgi:hypothetical protein